jgi:hypothetical protein
MNTPKSHNKPQLIESKPVETKEQAFHRRMDAHYKVLQNRFRMMRKTLNGARPSNSDADLLCLAVEAETAKFVAIVRSRIQEEESGVKSVWQ